MGNFGKWIGGSLGWVMGGPIGGLLGFLVGSVVDSTTDNTFSYVSDEGYTTPGAFGVSLLVLIAGVMKVDGKVVRSELDYVKKFLVSQFGKSSASEATKILRDLLKKDIPVKDVCVQIKSNMDYSSRLQLLHLLYNVSIADGRITQQEIDILDKISHYLGISASDFLSIKNMFVPDTDSYYKILEINPSATDDEVKKSYRKMAMKYHPDKVIHLGDDFKKSAEEKFRKVNEAYEMIKKERNMP